MCCLVTPVKQHVSMIEHSFLLLYVQEGIMILIVECISSRAVILTAMLLLAAVPVAPIRQIAGYQNLNSSSLVETMMTQSGKLLGCHCCL